MKTVAFMMALAFGATAANAVGVVGAFGAPDPGKSANQDYVVTFDAPDAAGYSWTGGLGTSCASLPGVAAAPAGDATCFGYVSSDLTPNTATLDTPDLQSISFYWGSIDLYNTVEVLDQFGNVLLTETGGMLPPSNGDQSLGSTNRRIFFSAGAGERISGLRFTSTGVAYEFDDFAANVPEPASWAMLIAGFGLVGATARRRRMTSVTA
ncbi:PEPxxWA-CTERM sorting domain-containing protein [Sandarakinorhabdus sp.]|uniref:PEPxxWA-CTERM sorting domain-containing protein n=1 Tax=Sandarakinorhabdus sp. TaxID=1916663 RepID=UPI00286E63E8|nr:PEPxxWA-CTERM sorting domain-containing protein [Sandarakinorhabdus sp.]